ncbi:DDE-type integrase/transposase/recombinase [Providencia rustigianii]|nr:DDE-type integrase/transposase/recombinase [Providencia rustigianii]
MITDAYSRKIVGYHLDDNMKTNAVKKSLLRALKKRSSTTSLIHHSDRGLQYCSVEYQEIHKKYNERRPHLSLNYKTPNEVHRAFYT